MLEAVAARVLQDRRPGPTGGRSEDGLIRVSLLRLGLDSAEGRLSSPKANSRKAALIIAVVALAALVVAVYAASDTPYGCPGCNAPGSVSITAASCSSSPSATCTVTFSNVGTAEAYLAGCYINLRGTDVQGTVVGKALAGIPAGTTATGSCALDTPGGTSGSVATGHFVLVVGFQVEFSGTWA